MNKINIGIVAVILCVIEFLVYLCTLIYSLLPSSKELLFNNFVQLRNDPAFTYDYNDLMGVLYAVLIIMISINVLRLLLLVLGYIKNNTKLIFAVFFIEILLVILYVYISFFPAVLYQGVIIYLVSKYYKRLKAASNLKK